MILNKFKNSLFYLLFCFLIVNLTSCVDANQPELKVASNNWLGYQPLYLAEKLGYYKETQIKLIPLPSATEVIHALRTGTIDAAALTLDETLSIIQDGFELNVILIFDISKGADAVVAKNSTTNLHYLKNKEIAYENTAVGGLMLNALLQKTKLKSNDIKTINCNFNEHLTCFNSVDAVITFEPIKSKLIKEGGHVIFDSSQIPNQIMDVLVIPKNLLSTHAVSIKALIKGYYQARTFMQKQPKKSNALLSKIVNASEENIVTAFQGLKLPTSNESYQFLKQPNSRLNQQAIALENIMIDAKLLRKKSNLTQLSNGTFIKELIN